MRTGRRSFVVIAAVAITLMGAGAAVAVWTNTGSGGGDADTGSVQPVTLSIGTPGAPLYPGAQVGVNVTITNPNLGAARVGSIALDSSQGTGGFGVDAGHSACVLSALAFTTQTNGGAGWDLSPRVGSTDGTLSVSMPAALTMSVNAVNACQGATFTVFLEVGP